MKVLLYQPDIATNVGAAIRICACLDLELNIIEPCGFPFDSKKIKRVGMDYVEFIKLNKFTSLDDFKLKNPNNRIVLLSTKATVSFTDFAFRESDVLMVGRETAGVPDFVHKAVDEEITIPMKNNMRCLNVISSLAMGLAVAMKDCRERRL
jgi:tRNA (cytidine/uridine-2'-O-)-methyltransferase